MRILKEKNHHCKFWGNGLFGVKPQKKSLEKRNNSIIIKSMEKGDSENLKALRESVDKILAIMQKPKKLIANILEGVALGVGILSVLGTIDIIRLWIGG